MRIFLLVGSQGGTGITCEQQSSTRPCLRLLLNPEYAITRAPPLYQITSPSPTSQHHSEIKSDQFNPLHPITTKFQHLNLGGHNQTTAVCIYVIFFHLVRCLPASSILSQVTGFTSFRRLNSIPLYINTIFGLSIHPSQDMEVNSATWLL